MWVINRSSLLNTKNSRENWKVNCYYYVWVHVIWTHGIKVSLSPHLHCIYYKQNLFNNSHDGNGDFSKHGSNIVKKSNEKRWGCSWGWVGSCFPRDYNILQRNYWLSNSFLFNGAKRSERPFRLGSRVPCTTGSRTFFGDAAWCHSD